MLYPLSYGGDTSGYCSVNACLLARAFAAAALRQSSCLPPDLRTSPAAAYHFETSCSCQLVVSSAGWLDDIPVAQGCAFKKEKHYGI